MIQRINYSYLSCWSMEDSISRNFSKNDERSVLTTNNFTCFPFGFTVVPVESTNWSRGI